MPDLDAPHMTDEQLDQREIGHLTALMLFSTEPTDRALAGWGGFDETDLTELGYWCRFVSGEVVE